MDNYFHNVLQLTEVGYYEPQTLNLKQMLNRSRNANITTTPPILVSCCYVPFFIHEFNLEICLVITEVNQK